MNVIIALTYPNLENLEHPFLYLAGDITSSIVWQNDLIGLLKDNLGTIFNPRRKRFSMDNPNQSFAQIQWNHRMIKQMDAVIFCFTIESNPITLLELGLFLTKETTSGRLYRYFPTFICILPNYEKQKELEMQISLWRSDIHIVNKLEDLAIQIIKWIHHIKQEER